MAFSTANVNIAALAQFIASFGNLSVTNNPIQLAFGNALTFDYGTGALQAKYVYGNTLTVASSGSPTTIDITALLQPDGSAAAFADLVVVGFRNRGAATQSMTVGGGSTPIVSVWGSGNLALPVGGSALFANPNAAGYAIDASTAKNFRVSVAAGTLVPFDIILLGH